MNLRNSLIILPFIFVSCVDLTEEPKSFSTTEQFYKTDAEAIAAVNSIYSSLVNSLGIYNSLAQIAIEMQSDDAVASVGTVNPDVRSLSVLTHNATNQRIASLWSEHYFAIARSNIAIDRIPLIDMDTILRSRLVREAKFIRGLLYFNLVRLWGEVPLVLHEPASLKDEDIHTAKSSIIEVYNQIFEDLHDAENLPSTYVTAETGRVTGGAAKSLLSKVHLTRGEWRLAAEKALEVIEGPYGYALFPDYADVFKVSKKNGIEHIFSAQFKYPYIANSLGSRGTPSGVVPGVTGGGNDCPASGLYELYNTGDKRRDVTFMTSLVSPKDGKTYTFTAAYRKYFDPDVFATPARSSVNVPILRFADILLIYGEALNELVGPTNEAYEVINKVRRRAFGYDINTPNETVDLKNLTSSQLRDTIYLERRKEFIYEQQRWFDLIRTKRMISELHAHGKPNASEKHYLYPIPQTELDLNPKLVQNPDWE